MEKKLSGKKPYMPLPKYAAVLRILLLCAGAAFVLAGIFCVELRLLYMKAVFICMECIGLG